MLLWSAGTAEEAVAVAEAKAVAVVCTVWELVRDTLRPGLRRELRAGLRTGLRVGLRGLRPGLRVEFRTVLRLWTALSMLARWDDDGLLISMLGISWWTLDRRPSL